MLIFYEWLSTIVLASARLLPVFFLLPFLNSSVISTIIRYPLVIIVSFSLYPFINFNSSGAAAAPFTYFFLLLKEVGTGMVLALILSLPFWVFYIAGNIIDQQRGATLSSTYDPLTGIDSSELASFFNLFAALIFLLQGGIQYMLQLFQISYQILDPMTFHLPHMKPLLTFLNVVVSKGIVLSAPPLMAFFMVEIILGLLSRYAPQMNSFSVAMSIKSLIAFFILLLYFVVYAPGEMERLIFFNEARIIFPK